LGNKSECANLDANCDEDEDDGLEKDNKDHVDSNANLDDGFDGCNDGDAIRRVREYAGMRMKRKRT
jgi:hypothetical protein